MQYADRAIMKKHITIILPVIFILLISSVFIVYYLFDADFLIAAKTDRSEIDRLMDDLGVIKLPQSSEPVEIRLKDVNGNTINLSDFRGKIVFLNFWTTWCPTCRDEMPSMENLHQRFKNEDFAMVTINIQESASQVRKFYNKFKLTFSALLDTTGEVGADFSIRSIPTTFILDKNGRIIGGALGPREWDGKEAVALFKRLTN